MNQLELMVGNRRYLIAIAIGLLAGFVSAIAGGRSLIVITILLLFGFPVDMSIATAKFGSMGSAFGTLKRYRTSSYILRKRIPLLTVLAVGGGYIGSHLLINIPEDILLPSVGIILIALLPLLFIYPETGEVAIQKKTWTRYSGYLLYFLAAVYGGLFGGGSGLLILYISLFFFGFTILQMKATSIIPWFLLNVTAALVFFQAGLIDVQLGLLIFVGMIFGGYIGAHVAIKKGNKRLKWVMAVFIVISSVKLLWPYVTLF